MLAFCARVRTVPERISLPGIQKKKKTGRSSPMEVDEEEAFTCGDLDTVYINLTKRVDRKKLIQSEMRAQGLKGRRFPARSGDDVKDSLVTRQWHSKLNCLYDKKTLPALHNMSKGERGCSGSHIALWKQCARRNDPTKPMLILEDDAVLWERSGASFTELTHRLMAAVEQVCHLAPPTHRACRTRVRTRARSPVDPEAARRPPHSRACSPSPALRIRSSRRLPARAHPPCPVLGPLRPDVPREMVVARATQWEAASPRDVAAPAHLRSIVLPSHH